MTDAEADAVGRMIEALISPYNEEGAQEACRELTACCATHVFRLVYKMQWITTWGITVDVRLTAREDDQAPND